MDSASSSKSGESFNGSSDSGEFSSNEEFDEEKNNVGITKCGEQRGPRCTRGKKFWRRLRTRGGGMSSVSTQVVPSSSMKVMKTTKVIIAKYWRTFELPVQ